MSVYWITGASSGIGEALAHELVSQGHQVILSARNEKKLAEVQAKLIAPDKAKILSFDVAETNTITAVADKAFALFGGVDALILNAGLSQRSLAQETSLDVYRKLMDVNYFGNVALTQAVLPKFLAKNKGQFVVVTSLVGKFGTPYRSGYSASKHALHGFFDSLRAEMMMQDKSVDVTILCPGFVNTDVSYNALGGSGNAIHVRDESTSRGMDPRVFAKKAADVIYARKYEDYIGGKEVLGVKLKRFFPDLFAKKIAKAKVR